MTYVKIRKPKGKLKLTHEKRSPALLERFYLDVNGNKYMMQHFTGCAYSWYAHRGNSDKEPMFPIGTVDKVGGNTFVYVKM